MKRREFLSATAAAGALAIIPHSVSGKGFAATGDETVSIAKYTHPGEIPMSKTLFFEWAGEGMITDIRDGGDTHPQTWADDDDIYIGTGDPHWFMKDGKKTHGDDPGARDNLQDVLQKMQGQVVEKLTGYPPNVTLWRVNDMPGYMGAGGNGGKPCGMICVNGVLYYAIQNLLGMKTPPHRKGSQHGSDATIVCSKDHGKTWEPDLNEMQENLHNEQFSQERRTWLTTEDQRKDYKGWKPMFPGSDFGGPSFVQFGKNNENAIDDYVYAISTDQWDNGQSLRLGRVHKNSIMERNKWEFYASGNWVKDLAESTPVLDIEGHISLPEMVYIPTLKKYILLTWALHNDFYTLTGSELTILESDNMWGPFSLAYYEWMWEKRELCAYTPRIPLKWFDESSLEGYILHSGNWGYMAKDGSWISFKEYYRPHIRKFKFSLRNDPIISK